MRLHPVHTLAVQRGLVQYMTKFFTLDIARMAFVSRQEVRLAWLIAHAVVYTSFFF